MTTVDEIPDSELSSCRRQSGFLQSNVVIILTLLYLSVVLPLAYLLNIWADEASTLYTTQFGFFQAFQHALPDEKQAPLYFWFLSLWREINGSIFFSRFFSILCSGFAVKFFYDLSRRFFDWRTAVAATAFFALHPYLIWAGLEIRVYALVILLSVLLLKLFDLNFIQPDFSGALIISAKRFFHLIFFTLLAVTALYTNYYLGFTLVGLFAALLILKKWRASGFYLVSMSFAGLAFTPLLWTVKAQMTANTAGYQSEKSFAEALQVLWGLLLTFILPTEIFTTDTSTAISAFRLWLIRFLILAVIILLIKNRRRPGIETRLFGAVSCIILIFLFAAYYLLGSDYVSIRHAAVLFAPFVLLIFSVLREVFQEQLGAETRRRGDAETRGEEEQRSRGAEEQRRGEEEAGKKGEMFEIKNDKNEKLTTRKYPENPRVSLSPLLLVSSSAIILAFFTYSVWTLYPHLSKRGDWARVAAYLESHEQPNQPVIIFTTFDALALPYYYHGPNQILPDERYFDFELEAEPGSAGSWQRQTNFIISKIPPGAPEIWLVVNDKCSIKDACEPLENFVRSNYTIVQEQKFYEETVRLLRKK